MDVETPLPSAAVIGLGRFGRFWAEMLSSQFSVVGTSRRTIPDLPAAVQQVELPEALTADYIFLCVAISAMPEVLDRIAPHLPPGATVVDTCSVKVFPVAEMEARLPQEVGIIATHPMFGPDSARERTDRLPVITWPVRDAVSNARHARRGDDPGGARPGGGVFSGGHPPRRSPPPPGDGPPAERDRHPRVHPAAPGDGADVQRSG